MINKNRNKYPKEERAVANYYTESLNDETNQRQFKNKIFAEKIFKKIPIHVKHIQYVL